PPERLQVVLELDPERPVVPEAVDAAVDLARLPDEAAPRAERDDRVHLRDGLGEGRRGRGGRRLPCVGGHAGPRDARGGGRAPRAPWGSRELTPSPPIARSHPAANPQ